MKNLLSLLALSASALVLHGQSAASTPLNERVMVVYNSNGDDSHKVAKYYMEKRAVPKENICKIDTDLNVIEDGTLFEPEVKKPVRACLEKIGKQKILYILFAYETPYAVNFDGHAQAIDQLVADIWDEYAGPRVLGREAGDQPYFGKAQSQGNIYEPFVPFAKYREQPAAKTIYCVWRIDGATAEAAKGLVDKALYAESHGLKGNAYFDIRGRIEDYVDSGYGAGEWDIYRASQMAKKAGFETTLDNKPTEFGTAPSQLRCDNAALYAGWYSLSHYNDAFSWAPGAIGFHLDSASATNPRGKPDNWVAGALERGITVTSGSVTEPYLEGLVHPDQIFRYLFQGANVGDAVVRGTRWLKWMIINLGDPLYRPFPEGVPPFASTSLQESWLGLSPNNLVGSGTVRAQFSLTEKRDKTVPVIFKSTYSELVALPTNATIPPAATGAKFQIAVKSPDQPVNITISVTAGNETVSNTLNVYPILTDFTLSQPSMKSDGRVTGTVTIMVPAREPGLIVKLNSSQPEAVVPGELQIPTGARKATFSITGKPVKGEVTATITAKFDNTSKTAQLKIKP
jgi:uncharacterized protein (TIGR03790 family)